MSCRPFAGADIARVCHFDGDGYDEKWRVQFLMCVKCICHVLHSPLLSLVLPTHLGSDVISLVRAYHDKRTASRSSPLPSTLVKRRMISSTGHTFTPLVLSHRDKCRLASSYFNIMTPEFFARAGLESRHFRPFSLPRACAPPRPPPHLLRGHGAGAPLSRQQQTHLHLYVLGVHF